MLSLAGLVVDGPDFVLWKNRRAMQKYWEGRDGYACVSEGDKCVCNGAGDAKSELTVKPSSLYFTSQINEPRARIPF